MHRLFFTCAAGLLALAVLNDRFNDWVARTNLPPTLREISVEVVDRNGQLLRVFPVENGIWRMATGLGDVDPGFVEMLVRAEDKRFYRHAGVDPMALLRAAGQAVWHGRVVSGGSTLTMQTARLIENSGTGGWVGKLRQIRVALALEHRLSKAQILTLYLTHAPYGGNLEGVRAASFAWFGKPAKRLSAQESALLVALPQAPTARRSDRHPHEAKAARDWVLLAQGFTETDLPVPQKMAAFPAIAPHLTDRARRSAQAGVVALTVDRDVQRSFEALAKRAAASLPAQSSAAILAADYQTGEIAAYVGAARFGDAAGHGFVDMVQAVRSPGSTLKPLIYGQAFDLGLAHPETTIPDRPIGFGSYAPQNFDGHFRGDVSVRQALEQSLNIPPVLLVDAMGPQRLMQGLRRSGASPRLAGGQAGLAVALGGVGLTLEELVTLYAGLARGGTARPLVWQRGQFAFEGQKIVSRSAAWQVGHILAGIQPPDGQPRGRIAFKTGTSYGHRDAWAIGWDGRHVIGVWLGRPDGTPVPGVFGGDIAAPILFEAFERVKPALDPLPPPPPETLMVSNAFLPKPLRDFGTRQTQGTGTQIEVAFPPNGARLRRMPDQGVPMKLRGGEPPFTVLTNGVPVLTGVSSQGFELPRLSDGFSEIRVIDAAGRSDHVQIRIE